MARKKLVRVFSGIMALLMVLSILPANVLAAEDQARGVLEKDVIVKIVEAEQEEVPVPGASVSIKNGTTKETDDSGCVTLSGLTVGTTYELTVAREGYEEKTQEFRCTEKTTEVTVALNMLTSVMISVTNEEGDALEDAEISISDKEKTVTTDESGNATVQDLVVGKTYTVTAKCTGHADTEQEFVCQKDMSVTVKMTAYQLITVSGTVLCDQEPVRDAQVTLNVKGSDPKTTNTDEEGKFSFEDIYRELVESLTVSGEPYQETVLEQVGESNTITLEKKTFAITAEVVDMDNKKQGGEISFSEQSAKYGESVTVEITAEEGYSIYGVFDNETIVEENASGKTKYQYVMENIAKEHKLTVVFCHEVEKIAFWVNSKGEIKQDRDNTSSWQGSIKVKWTNGQMKVEYTPSKNYRVSAVTIEDGNTTYFQDNNQTYTDAEGFSLNNKEKRKYEIEIRPNRFRIELAQSMSDEDKNAVQIRPESGYVNYDKDGKILVTPPEGKYLSKMEIFKTGEEGKAVDVCAVVAYDGEIPVYTLKNIQEDKTVCVGFSDIEDNGDDNVQLCVTPAPEVKVLEVDSVYYLGQKAKIVISVNGYQISRNPDGYFSEFLEMSGDDILENLYLLKNGIVTKVPCNLETVSDELAPEIKSITLDDQVSDENKVTCVTVTVHAADGKNGAGVDRIVYSTDKELSAEEISNLSQEGAVMVNDDGSYTFSFENDRRTYYFWAIDKVGNVSGVSEGCEVDSDIEGPVVSEVIVDVESYRAFAKQDDSNAFTYYPKVDGIKFAVEVKDELSNMAEVELYIGQQTFEMKLNEDTKYYECTVKPKDLQETGDLEVSVIAADDSRNKNKSAVRMCENTFYFEQTPPSIECDLGESDAYVDVDGNKWYNSTVDFTVTLIDNESGLDPQAIVIKNLGDEIYPKKESKSSIGVNITYKVEGKEQEYSVVPYGEKVVEAVVSLKVNAEKDDVTSFSIQVAAHDNEGNSAESDPIRFWIDRAVPVIEKMDIGDNESEAVVSEVNETVEATEYGYFFCKETTIVVYASDEGSGVKEIGFYAVEKDSENKVAEQTKTGKDIQKAADGRWYADFLVPENFKGQIYAYAVDLAENQGKNYHPEDLTITETQKHHEAEEHITSELPETKLRDVQGIPLYSMVEYVYDENGNVRKDESGHPIEKEDSDYQNGVPVSVTITDTFNGIGTVKYSKDKDDKGNDVWTEINLTKITWDNNGSFEDENGVVWSCTDVDCNLYTKLSATVYVTDNRNGIRVKMEMTDMSNNISVSECALSIDNTAPSITFTHLAVGAATDAQDVPTDGEVMTKLGDTPYFVGFNTNEEKLADQYPIYDRSTLQIKITERNLNSDLEGLVQNAIKVLTTNDVNTVDKRDITKELKIFGPFEDDPEKGRVAAQYPYTDSTYYLIELRDCNEEAIGGTYVTNFAVTDLAGHKTSDNEFFVIDETAPVITITFNNNLARNGKYYNADRTATITVVERNFNNESAKMSGKASDRGTETDFPELVGWNDSDDYMTHVATVSFNSDGLYQNFGLVYTDLADRESVVKAQEFYVDKTAPTLSISGVEDKSANNGTMAPYITYTDTNMDFESVEITLTGINNGVAEYDAVKTSIDHGEKYVYYDFDHEKTVDDVYTLYAHVVDMAGNTATQMIQFSCNRFGSVFDLSQIQDMLGKYNQKERTIVITETNVDAIDLDSARVTLTKNGTPMDLTMGKDFVVEALGTEGTWHQYIYTVLGDLFAADGTYSLYFYTEDTAGNINENIDESKEAQISFGIDKTKPIATLVDFESEAQYALEKKIVSVEIKDNLLLGDVKIYLNGTEIPYVVDGDDYIFDIPMDNAKQTVKIVAVDAAGNEEEILVKDFLVTTNFFARWYFNTPLFIGSIIVLVMLLIVLVWRLAAIFYKKKNKKEEI